MALDAEGNEITEKTGSEPEDKTKAADSSAAGSGKDGESQTHEDENLPWHKDPRFQKENEQRKELIKSHEKVTAIMKANDLDSYEDLLELVESGKKVIGKISDIEDLDELIEKAQKLDQWTEYYARKAEQEREKEETSEQTIARLKKEKRQLEHDRAQDQNAREGEFLLKDFSKTVESTVNEVFTDLPESQKQFITEFFGVNNPFAVIDIGDKRAVKKMVTEGKKKFEAFKKDLGDQAIKDYVAGKRAIPTVASTGGATAPKTIRKTMATARAAMHERLDHLFG
jgi:hypothetical protein